MQEEQEIVVDLDAEHVRPTFRDVRNAWNAIRMIDGFDGGPQSPIKPLQAFRDNMRARYCAMRLQKELKDAVDISEQRLQELREPYVARSEGLDANGIRFATGSDRIEYDRAERSVLMEYVDIDVAHIALKLSVIGDSLKFIPADLLVDLGPFLHVDIDEPVDAGPKRKG